MDAWEWPVGAEGWHVEWPSGRPDDYIRRIFRERKAAEAYVRNGIPPAFAKDATMRRCRIQLLPDRE